jgi:hypothetical protein
MRLPLLAAALCAAQLAAAEEERSKASDVLKPAKAAPAPSPVTDRFALRVSYFPASVATDMRLDGEDGTAGTELSAEDDLGMSDRQDQARVEVVLRAAERNRMRIDYLKLTRRGNEVLGRTLDFGEETLAAGSQVESLLDWRMLNLTYLYSVLRLERFELGAGVALHLFEADARARVRAEGIHEEKSGVAAFPTLALDGAWRITERFTLTARANYLSADVDDSSGSISDVHADVQFRWRPNFTVGLGYTALSTELDVVDDEDLSGLFAFDVDGPELFFRASF